MTSTYQISFRTKLKNSIALQSLHDCLKKLNVKHWTYDFQKLILTLRSDLPDFKRIQTALQTAGYKCDFVKLENLGLGTI
jgi:tRNA G26 N,N-dimethylase Trm1